MPQLTRLASSAGLMACAFSVCAANHPMTTSQHWGVGVQAAVVKSTVNSQAYLEDTDGTPDDSVTTRQMGSATTGLLGVSVGRYWSSNASTWGLQLEANQGIGSVFLIHQTPSDTGINGSPTEIHTDIKAKQQYNLMLLWKHTLASDTSLLAGLGISAVNTETRIGFYDNKDYNFVSELNRVNPGESRYSFGPVFSFGFEHTLSGHSAVDFTLRYTAYGSTRLSDFNNFSIFQPNYNTDNLLRDRKITLDQLALSVSYHYYF